MSKARSLSKLINKDTYIARFGESSVTDLAPTETDVASSISSNPIPAFVGMIGAFSMATTTEWKTANRWLICDGSPVSRTTYSDLFTVVGTTWGTGDGSSTFNLPDLRGEFLRGFDDASGNDPDAANRTGGNVVGSSQLSMVRNHVHWIESWAGYNGSSGSYNPNNQGYGGAGPYGESIYSRQISDDTTQSNKNFVGSSETRPRNKYVQYCIKF